MGDPQHDTGLRAPFWQSMAGMLTAIAALITALVGVAALVYQISRAGNDDGHEAAAPSTVASSGGSGPARTTASTSTAPPAGSAEQTGAGPYELLFNNNGVDIDADPPKIATGSDPSIDIYDGGGAIQSYPIWSGLAKWSQPGTPSRQDCIALLNSFATISSTYLKGSRYCVHTRRERHIAFLEFVEPTDGGWKIRVTVWPGTAA